MSGSLYTILVCELFDKNWINHC